MDYQSVLDSLADAIVVSGLDDRIVHLNPAAERLLGWTCAEVKGSSLKVLMPERMHAAHERGFNRFVATRQPHILGRAVRVPALRKDGVEIEIELALSTFPLLDGHCCIVATIRDLSDRIELERHLRISRYLKAANAGAATLAQKLEVAHVVTTATTCLVEGLEAALGRIWLYEREKNRLVLRSSAGLSERVNDSSHAILDLSSHSSPVATVARTLSPLVTNDLALETEIDPACVQKDALKSMAVLPLVVGGDLRGVLAAFFRFPLPEEVVEALVTFSSLVASALNDSLLHEAERASRERFEDFVNGINHGIVWEADAATLRVTFVSAKAEQVLGYPLDAWYSEPSFWLDRVHPDDRARVVEALRAVAESNQDIGVEHRLVKPDGSVLWVRTGARLAQMGPGAGTMIHALSADITSVKLAEARAATTAMQAEEARAQAEQARRHAEEASRLKDEFLTTVSHELRTPLSAILGWAMMLGTDRPSDAASIHKGVKVIERNARSQLRIIEDILDVSRIVRGQLRIDTEPLDLQLVIKEMLESVKPAADAKQITLAFNPAEGPYKLIADPERLRQVLWNLLSNAVKFTPAGGLVNVRVRQESGSHVVEVGDTGQGIDPAFMPYVFDRFRQAEGTVTRSKGGLGLGLAIVKHLVEMHGGTVGVTSAGLGHGATFTITLPVKPFTTRIQQVSKDPTQVLNGNRYQKRGALGGLRLLVVEDEPDSRELIEILLSSEGAEVQTASSAREALNALEGFQPDMLVSDIGMAGHDGYWLIGEVRKTQPFLPAVALTAYTRREDALRARKAGFNEHVGKPVDPVRLVQTIAGLRAD